MNDNAHIVAAALATKLRETKLSWNGESEVPLEINEDYKIHGHWMPRSGEPLTLSRLLD